VGRRRVTESARDGAAPGPLFVYGTLMEPRVRAEVLGPDARATARPARLRGYRRVAVPGFAYPVIEAGAPEDVVDGRLLEGLTAGDYTRLDAYEDVDDGLYARVRVTVEAGDEHLGAWAYVRGPALGG
jgi:gamma-glutamylaminecyclotransferase